MQSVAKAVSRNDCRVRRKITYFIPFLDSTNPDCIFIEVYLIVLTGLPLPAVTATTRALLHYVSFLPCITLPEA